MIDVGWGEGERQRAIWLAVLLSIQLRWCSFLYHPSLTLGRDLPLGFLYRRRRVTGRGHHLGRARFPSLGYEAFHLPMLTGTRGDKLVLVLVLLFWLNTNLVGVWIRCEALAEILGLA